MKIEKFEAFASYPTDGEGYKHGAAFAYFPFKAAAEADLEARNLRGYGCTRSVNCIRLEDTIYVLSGSEQPIEKLVGKCSKYVPLEFYEDYCYINTYEDETKYYFSDDLALKLLRDKNRHSLKKILGLTDDKYLYILESDVPITIAKFAMSRELAVAHARSKLTEEEKGLLGL